VFLNSYRDTSDALSERLIICGSNRRVKKLSEKLQGTPGHIGLCRVGGFSFHDCRVGVECKGEIVLIMESKAC
jgi:hypothetical protein